ncbi:MAG TPA: hypothetical protein VFB33_00115 [Candidatus Binataceae bacterium]|nr:hypothetical protein [Candidatus Binataceae bacterium]
MRLNIPANLALAAAAWVLLAPPHTSGTHAPLNQWSRVGTYETQAACEHEKKLWRSGTHRIKENPGELREGDVYGKIAPESMVCVSDDDPRLKRASR